MGGQEAKGMMGSRIVQRTKTKTFVAKRKIKTPILNFKL